MWTPNSRIYTQPKVVPTTTTFTRKDGYFGIIHLEGKRIVLKKIGGALGVFFKKRTRLESSFMLKCAPSTVSVRIENAHQSACGVLNWIPFFGETGSFRGWLVPHMVTRSYGVHIPTRALPWGDGRVLLHEATARAFGKTRFSACCATLTINSDPTHFFGGFR